MAALWQWDDTDLEVDEWLASLMSAPVGGTAADTLLERLEAARPAWQRAGACRDRPDVSWFDDRDVVAARTICEGCPVTAVCGEYGRREPAGMWGGQWRTQPGRPGAQVAVCGDCGTDGPVHAVGVCQRCYHRRRRARQGVAAVTT